VAQRVVGHLGALDIGRAQVAVDDVAHAAAAQAVAAGEIAVGDDQPMAEFVGRDASTRGQVGAHRVGDVGSEKDQAVVVLAMDQQCPAVAVTLQVVDVGARDFHRAQRLQAEQPKQRAIAQVLELVIVWHGTKQPSSAGRPFNSALPMTTRLT
jgi:hypothetical protein